MAANFIRYKPDPLPKGTVPDYKHLDVLRRYMVDSGRILPSRITGVDAKFQRGLSNAVKVARFLALIPYCDAHRN